MVIPSAAIIRDEIADLAEYLSGLPPSLRDSPYATIYRQRLAALRSAGPPSVADHQHALSAQGPEPRPLTRP